MSLTPSPELLSLAPELVENVIKHISDRRDLSNVRLTCKLLDKYAVKELFKDVYISPSENRITNWNTISKDNVIRWLPRRAIIHTHPDIEDHGLGVTRKWLVVDEHNEDGSIFDDALAALSRFPNLDSLEIAFTPECLGQEESDWQEVAENRVDREAKLSLIFQSIKDRAADKSNGTIRKLTIVNLQNCPIPDFSNSELFHDVMGQLEELHVSVTQEYNEHGPDQDYTKIELQTFPTYFCTHWLKPISANLKALSIYSKSENWGPFPGYFDPRGITFPKLERLALGYYTLAHDNDLDWIIAIKSLRQLILHNCMIASYIRIDSEELAEWKPPRHDWVELSITDGNYTVRDFAYGGTWSQHLDRIAKGLPNLVDLRFGYGNSHEKPVYGVEHRDDCPTEIFYQRYVLFDNGTLPTPWIEPDYEGEEIDSWLDDELPDLHKEHLNEDRRSLDALLVAVRSRN